MKIVWVLTILTGGSLGQDASKPIVETPLARYWTKTECEDRLKKYDSPDGRAKLKELAHGEGYRLKCLDKEVPG